MKEGEREREPISKITIVSTVLLAGKGIAKIYEEKFMKERGFIFGWRGVKIWRNTSGNTSGWKIIL